MSENKNDLKEPLNKNFREPKFRFNSFKESWSECTFGSIFSIVTDYVAAGSFADIKNNVCYLSEPDYAQLIRTTDLKSKFKNNDFVYVNKKSFEYLYRVNIDCESIILPNVGINCGEVYFVKPTDLPYNKNVLGPNAILVRSKDHDNYFLSLVLQSKKAQKELSTIVSSQGQPKFNKTDLKKIKIDICTSRVEEEKIKKLFCLVESLINCEGCKIDILKKYKKGLQKVLFNNENYKYVKLKKVASFQQKSKYGANAGTSSGVYPFYLSGEKISSLNNYMYDGIYIIANDGGEANFRITNGRFSYSDHCICLKGFDDYKTKFIFNYLESIKEKITYAGFVGSGLKNIDRDYFENLPIPICDDLTTRAYSDLFSIVDEIINKHDSQLASLKKLKLYLLSNMFI